MSPKIEETIVLDFITASPTTGAATDADSTPTCEVFEDANDTSILSPTVTKRTSKTGNYRVSIACTAANGFEAGKSYNAVVSATVGGVAAKAVIGSFQVRARNVDDASTLDAAGIRTAIGLADANLDTQLTAIDDAVDAEVAAIIATLGTPVGVSLSADLAAVQSDTNDLQTRLPAALVGGRMASIAEAVGAGAINNAAFAAGAIDSTTLATDTIGSSELASSAANKIRDAILSDSTPFAGASVAAIKARTDLIPDSPAAVGSEMILADGSITAAKIATGAIDADALATDAVTEIVTGILAAVPTPRNVTAVTTPTVADCLIAAFCGAAGDESISGTTYLVKQPDGTSTFRTFTLDSSTLPTSRT